MLNDAFERRLRAFGRRFATERSGVALVEFAFIAPLLILLYFALAQLSEAIVASRHANHSASSLGDLVSQCVNVNDSDLSNMFAAGSDILAPLPVNTTVLGQRITSMEIVDSNSDVQAQWSQASDSSSLTHAYPLNQTLPANTLPPNILVNQGDSVIVAETVYKYTFPVSTGGVLPMGATNVSLSFGQAVNFDNVTYFKPRRSTLVTYTGSGSGGSNQQTSCYSS